MQCKTLCGRLGSYSLNGEKYCFQCFAEALRAIGPLKIKGEVDMMTMEGFQLVCPSCVEPVEVTHITSPAADGKVTLSGACGPCGLGCEMKVVNRPVSQAPSLRVAGDSLRDLRVTVMH